MARQKITHAYYASASSLRREGHLYEDASYLRTGVKGCSKIKRVLAKPSYFGRNVPFIRKVRVLFKARPM